MAAGSNFRIALRSSARLVGLVLAISGPAAVSLAEAQDVPVHRRVAAARPVRVAASRPLTVHRSRAVPVAGPIVEDDDDYAPGGLRRWNDPNLESFGGWRVGGDNFYGDGAGDTITRGNSTLGAISGYGAARGGYGGPHFDSVGGFHNGPGPDAQEAADYASGSISRPDYGDAVPHYPTVKARVAALSAGVPVRARPARFSAPEPQPVAAPAPRDETDDGIDDMLPDIGGIDF